MPDWHLQFFHSVVCEKLSELAERQRWRRRTYGQEIADEYPTDHTPPEVLDRIEAERKKPPPGPGHPVARRQHSLLLVVGGGQQPSRPGRSVRPSSASAPAVQPGGRRLNSSAVGASTSRPCLRMGSRHSGVGFRGSGSCG